MPGARRFSREDPVRGRQRGQHLRPREPLEASGALRGDRPRCRREAAPRNRALTAAAHLAAVQEDLAMKKILLIEDNERNRDMLSRRLQKRGYEVVMAVDGETGVTMARTQAPGLILMDVSLPGI